MSWPELKDWWEAGVGSNTYTVFTSRSGVMSVYVRRNVLDRSVMEIANISSLEGFGGARALYREFCRDIPTIAENILNPELDALLGRLGWTHAYRDLAEIPTRINPAFMARFTRYAEANRPVHAIALERGGW
jgi:hypothetical protein